MLLKFDPTGKLFWENISKIPGFPKEDVIPLKTILIQSDAIYMLPEVIGNIKLVQEPEILVVMDPTEMKRGGERLKPLIINVLSAAGTKVEPLILHGDESGQVHTDFDQIGIVRDHINPNQVVISVGSGVITDITKHACYLFEKETGKHIPFIAYQTANSVSAFTSNMAPVFMGNVKRTLDSRYPDALICDLETLCDAPYEMTAAGVGDLLAFFISLPDWYLASELGMDKEIPELPQALMGELDRVLLENSKAIRDRTPEGMDVLAKLISLSGLVMSLSHATTPFSGYEHIISHYLDMVNESQNLPLPQHGTQVGLAALILDKTYRYFLTNFDPATIKIDDCFPTMEDMEKRVREAFIKIDPTGKTGSECWSDYKIKLLKWNGNRDQIKSFLENWSRIIKKVYAFLSIDNQLLEILGKVDSPLRFIEMEPPITEEKVKEAFNNAPLMRKRLTLGDLLIFFKVDREKIWQEVWGGTQN